MLRRISKIAICAFCLAIAVPAGTATGGGAPIREAVDPASALRSWPPGRVCPFALQREPVLIREYTLTFPADSNGDVRQILTGTAILKFTNLETGKSVVVKASGPATIIYHADGSALIAGGGHSTYELLATDTPPGPAELLSLGRLVIEVTTAGDFIVLSKTGRQENICDALA